MSFCTSQRKNGRKKENPDKKNLIPPPLKKLPKRKKRKSTFVEKPNAKTKKQQFQHFEGGVLEGGGINY